MQELVFEIPLLKEQIASNLLLKDIKNCTLVSTQWNDWFIPVLWRTVNIWYRHGRSYQGLSEPLCRNARYIQSIILNDLGIFVKPLPNLPILKSIKINSAYCADLFEHFSFESTMLKEISIIDIHLNDETSLARLANALKKVTSLNSLKMSFYSGNNPVDPEIIRDIIVSHGHLETFRIGYGPHVPELLISKEKLESIQEAINQMESPRIKNLELLFAFDNRDSALLYPLLRRCTHLERLCLAAYKELDLVQIIKILKECGHRHMKSLRIEPARPNPVPVEDFIAELGELNCKVDTNGSRKTDGVNELEMSHTEIRERTQELITQYFSNTLTSLSINSKCQVHIVACLLKGLPLLQKFSSGQCSPSGDYRLQDIHNYPWSCLDMEEFEIRLEIFPHMEGDYYKRWKGSVYEKTAEYFFTQLGRLTKLRRLAIRSNAHCLSLKYGFLEYLSNLKELRTIDLCQYTKRRTLPSPMEAEWMVDNWPKLETVYLPNALLIDSTYERAGTLKRIRNDASDAFRERKSQLNLIVANGFERHYIE